MSFKNSRYLPLATALFEVTFAVVVSKASYERTKAKTIATAKITPENSHLICLMRESNRAARPPGILVEFFD